jgi:hypothetical protein
MNARGYRRAALTTAIEAAEAEIADLGRRRAALEKQVEELRNDLRAEDDSEGHTVVATPALAGRLNAREKVALFRSLFHGREDVFPRFWVSPKTGKTGYSPTCRNDWARGVCEKPRVRCGSYLIAARARSAVVLVHRQPLLDQWVEQLSLHLGVDPRKIDRVGGGVRKPNGHLDVAMIQSLVRGDEIDEVVGDYGHVIVDECHVTTSRPSRSNECSRESERSSSWG